MSLKMITRLIHIPYRRRYKLDRKTITGPKNNTAYNKVFTLTITNFSAEDGGTYICVSRNVVGKKEKKISVQSKNKIRPLDITEIHHKER